MAAKPSRRRTAITRRNRTKGNRDLLAYCFAALLQVQIPRFTGRHSYQKPDAVPEFNRTRFLLNTGTNSFEAWIVPLGQQPRHPFPDDGEMGCRPGEKADDAPNETDAAPCPGRGERAAIGRARYRAITVQDNLARAAAAGLTWPLRRITDDALEQRLFARASSGGSSTHRAGLAVAGARDEAARGQSDGALGGVPGRRILRAMPTRASATCSASSSGASRR